ncbi:MAG: ribonuclease P protein component [Oscillospiraceae bacterium]|nr:ribonuclease P protein component [Oscillospiraceae bacterium]
MKYKLNKNKDFVRLYQKGKYVSGRICAVYFRKNPRNMTDGMKFNRIGISTGKKIGNAVRRSRARRVIRAALRGCELPVGYDIVIAARQGATECKSYECASFFRKKLIPAMSGQTETAKR